MPAKSKAQMKMMQAASHNKAFAKKAGVPMKVAKEYMKETPKKMKRMMKK